MLCGMNKLKEVPKEMIERARVVLKNARGVEQMRYAQAVILPAVHGFSAEQTAEALGVSRDSVYRFQAAFRQCEDISQLRERRGGRRNELMSFEQEKEFLSHWLSRAREGSMVVVSPVWEALEKKLGRRVRANVVYRMLARHGWRKLAPDTRHPKSDPAVQEDWKKNFRKSWRKS